MSKQEVPDIMSNHIGSETGWTHTFAERAKRSKLGNTTALVNMSAPS